MLSYVEYIQILQKQSQMQRLNEFEQGVLKEHEKCLRLESENELIKQLVTTMESNDFARASRIVLHDPIPESEIFAKRLDRLQVTIDEQRDLVEQLRAEISCWTGKG